MLICTPNLKIQNSQRDVLVNTVNTVGVMGKGLALDMKKAFPKIMAPYKQACSDTRLQPGTFQLIKVNDRQTVLNLATKQNWCAASRYDWIGSGLVYMNRLLADSDRGYRSVAMSMPGCGNGGLDARRVQQMMRIYLHRAIEAGVEIEVSHEQMDGFHDPVFFAGVGSRKTPAGVQKLMSEIGALMTEDGARLRSGGAVGADSAFWNGAREVDAGGMEIFLPKAKAHIPDGIVKSSPVFERLARNFHAFPEALTPDPNNPNDKRHYTLKLMSRNGNQIFGEDFRIPTNVVICWTPGGKAGGGTGQAIRLANSTGIPVIDLGRPELSGVSAIEVRDMARELISAFRISRGIKELEASSDLAPA